ncbi:hypothetical protein SEA_ACOLYTE_93 [Mycobacterium phage Acolyte]|nr:hypothetical protein SEA_ACOLYTE_93 [Mycobacterium phage Acolyte]
MHRLLIPCPVCALVAAVRPGGPVALVYALVALVGRCAAYRSSRPVSAWCPLVPRIGCSLSHRLVHRRLPL